MEDQQSLLDHKTIKGAVAGAKCDNLCGWRFEAGNSFEIAGGDTKLSARGSGKDSEGRRK